MRPWIYWIILNSLAGPLLAGPPEFEVSGLAGQGEPVRLGSYLECLRGETTFLSPEPIVRDPNWKAAESEIPNFGFSRIDVWVRFALRNSGTERIELRLESQTVWIDRIDFFREAPGGSFTHMVSGDEIPFVQHPVPHRNPVFPVVLKPGETARFYLRYHTRGSLSVPLLLYSREAFEAGSQIEYSVLGAYFGVMLALLIYNLILFLSLRERVYFFYCLYLASVITMYAVNLGFLFQFARTSRWWNDEGLLLLAALVTIALIQFSRVFLVSKQNTPWLDLCLRILVPVVAVFGFVPLFAYQFGVAGINTLATVSTLAVFALGIVSVARRVPQSSYFLFGWLCLLLGALIETMTTGGILPVTFIGRFGIQIGTIVEVLLFALALGGRIRTLTIERAETRSRLNQVEQELELARSIQARILPGRIPDLAGAAIHVRYIPLFAVGGDFYDFHVQDEHRAGIVIADVSGHGVAAALDSSTVKIAFQSVSEHAHRPDLVLSGMNHFLCENLQQTFVSALYAYFDLGAMQLSVASAGHPPLLLAGTGGQPTREITTDGMMLGIIRDCQFETRVFALSPGDRILLFTDGLFENFDENIHSDGLETMNAVVARTSPASGAGFQDAVIDEMIQWRGGKSPTDDVTFITVEIG